MAAGRVGSAAACMTVAAASIWGMLATGCSASDVTSGGTVGGGGSGAGGTGTGGTIVDGGDLDADLGDGATDPCGPDAGPDSGCACESIEFSIATQQSCAISILPGFEMDGEGFIELQNQQHRVFAIDRWGAGHVVAWCDATTLPELLEAFDVAGYLGQVADPRVASFGDVHLCEPGAIAGHPLPDWIEYQGFDLPAQYQGNPAALAADWDVIILCGFRMPWDTDWSAEIASFVATHGKGFLGVMDYEGVVVQTDFENISVITSPAGIVFDPLNLAWAPATAEVALDCIPDMPPPPR